MVEISGTTRLAGVIGWPLSHTLSPAIHNAAYAELGVDWVYVPLAVEDETGLRRLVAAARSLPFVGFNITMPYKEAMLELCDEVATAARMAGAVNTVQCSAEGNLVGYNTDGRGLLESLATDAGFDPAGKRVVLLGAGGAAGGAMVSLILGKAASVSVVNRSLERAEELLDRMAACSGEVALEALVFTEAQDIVESADLVVNATPVGMAPGSGSPIPVSWLQQGQVVLDMVYGTPGPTELVSGAKSRGAVAVDGLGMLVAQGAIAIDIWNAEAGVHAPRETMRAAAKARIARRHAAEVNG
jgi:shikimate dehydrogenase